MHVNAYKRAFQIKGDNMKNTLHVGLDIGSTTVKIVILNDKKETIYSNYERHFSDTKSTLYNVLTKFIKDYPNSTFTLSLTGSGALEISKILLWL